MNDQKFSKDFCMKILGKISQPVFVKDENGTFVYANDAFLQFLGVSIEDVIGKNFDDTLPAEQKEHFLKIDKTVMESGIENVCEENLTDRIIKTTKRPYVDENGNKFIVGNFEDITEIKRNETEILKKKEELIVLNRMKDTLFSIIAHDLRNSFNVILGYTEILFKEFDEMEKSQIKEISGASFIVAKRTYYLFDNLLNWAKSQKGILNLDPESFSPFKEIINVRDLFYFMAEDKDIQIEIRKDFEDIVVLSDKNLFALIMRNLINNAIKFTNRGGKIFITVEKKGNNFIEINVQDTGVGMSEEKMSNLFNPYVNTGTMGTNGEDSSGLGLMICKDFAEKLGGDLKVQSVLEKGSTFSFIFPKIFKKI